MAVSPLFYFHHPATTELYTLSLHDALPISFTFFRVRQDRACERREDRLQSLNSESGPLALPDVLPARTRNRLGRMFLCHRLPAHGTIFAPHNGPAFSSANRLQASGHAAFTDYYVELFPPLKRGQERERFSVSCNRSG